MDLFHCNNHLHDIHIHTHIVHKIQVFKEHIIAQQSTQPNRIAYKIALMKAMPPFHISILFVETFNKIEKFEMRSEFKKIQRKKIDREKKMGGKQITGCIKRNTIYKKLLFDRNFLRLWNVKLSS